MEKAIVIYVVETNLGFVRINEILFKGEITVVLEEIPVAQIKKYTSISSGEEIATTANFNISVQGKSIDLSFNRIAETGETHILLGANKDEA